MQTVGSVPTPRKETKSCQGDTQTVGSVPTPEVVCNSMQIVQVKEAWQRKPNLGGQQGSQTKEDGRKMEMQLKTDKGIGLRI